MQSFYIIEYILYAMFDTFCVELYFVIIFRFGGQSRYVIALGLKVLIPFHSQVTRLIQKTKVWRTSFDIKGTTLQNCSFVLQLSQQSVFSFGCALFLALKQ